MADAAFFQTSFLGGEWSPLAQGMMTDQAYRSALNVCRNGLPIEEGSWVRRPGTRYVAPTRSGRAAVLRPFHFNQSRPYIMELTAFAMRLIAGLGLVLDGSGSTGAQGVTAISAANPGVITTGSAHGWSTGDQVQFHVDPNDVANGNVNASLAVLLGRELGITVLSSTTFSVFDALSGVSIDCTGVTLGTTALTVYRVSTFTTPYAEADLPLVNVVQGQTNAQGNFALLLHNSYQPTALTNTTVEYGTNYAAFSYNNAVTFTDGPYFDPPGGNTPDGSLITPSATSGSVTLTLTQGTTAPVFSATDVGRSVRLFNEPAAWASGTAYTTNQTVKYNGAYYIALANNTGKEPDTDPINWGVAPSAATWVWATITAFTDATHVTATLKQVVSNGITGPNLPNTNACTFRMGVYSQTTGWPSCGVYHEGRLWLGGAQPNRFDASMSNDPFNMTPTAPDGTVADNNGISGVFNAKTSNTLYWMVPDTLGIICGTKGGEWLISASQTNDPITPTSIQAHLRTEFGCANTPAYRTGITIAFVNKSSRKLMEYVTTDWRGLTAKPLSLKAKHLATPGIAEIAYTRDKTPVIWARMADGSLKSCTYQRTSAFGSDPPDFSGWARHDMGAGMTVTSIAAGPNYDGTLDALTAVVNDGNFNYVVVVSDYFDTDWQIGDALFVDFATTPSMWQLLPNSTSPTSVKFYGLWRLAGKSVDVMLAGVDCGTLTVGTDGTLTIPFSVNPLLTTAYLAGLTSSTQFRGLGLNFLITPAAVQNPNLTGIASLPWTGKDMSTWQPDCYLVDWDRNRLLILGSDGTNNALYATDFQYRQFYGKFPSVNQFGSTVSVLTRDGGLVTFTIAFNVGTAHKYNGAFAHVGDFGAGSSQFNSDATHIQYPAYADSFQAGSTDFAILSALTGSEITFLNLTGSPLNGVPYWAGTNYAADEGRRAVVVHGRRTYTTIGEAWAACVGNTTNGTGNGDGPGLQLGIYRFVVQPTGWSYMTKAPKLTNPAAVYPAGANPAWTHFNAVDSLMYDEADGNLVARVSSSALSAWSSGTTYNAGDMAASSGHDFQSKVGSNLNHLPTVGGDANWTDLGVSSVNGSAICKLSTTTGQVLWTIKDLSHMFGSADLRQSRLNGIFYGWFNASGPTEKFGYINTLTGVYTQLIAFGSNEPGYEQYNSYNGVLIFEGGYDWNNGGSGFVGLYGISNPYGGWAILGPATGHVFFPPATATAAVYWDVPAAIGYAYPSQGQILRAVHPQEAGAQNGPALGKTRRSHMAGALLQQTQGIKFSTDFNHLHTANLTSPGGTTYAKTALFSGIWWDTLDDDYGFDSMLCWEIDRPYPATVCAVEPFLHTQDR